VLRYSSEPGAIETDTVARARGASLKVLDVAREQLREGWTSEGFLFNPWPIIAPGDANAYHQLIHSRSGEIEVLQESPEEVGLFDRTPEHQPGRALLLHPGRLPLRRPHRRALPRTGRA